MEFDILNTEFCVDYRTKCRYARVIIVIYVISPQPEY